MTLILTLTLLLTACGPTNEDVFVREAAKVACSCYGEVEYEFCVPQLRQTFQWEIDLAECSTIRSKSPKFDLNRTADCLDNLRQNATDRDEYCRNVDDLEALPEQDCESELTPYVFEHPEDPHFCENYEHKGPWYHESVTLLEICPDICK